MIDISLDLGNALSVLAALDDSNLAARAGKAAAESYNEAIHDWIAGGHAFSSREGTLKQSINWSPIPGGGKVFANAAYAGYVERGTGIHAGHSPWVIKPKAGRKGLTIPFSGGGGFIIRRSVKHSGSKAFPFFFADAKNRAEAMLAAARLVIFSAMAEA